MELSDWMGLDAVSCKIANLEDQLAGARSAENHGLVQLLEREIARSETIRERLISQIAASITSPHTSSIIDLSPDERVLEPTRPCHLNSAERKDTLRSQLSRADLEAVKCNLDRRRAETLARHIEEVKALDAEAAELDLLEQAIGVFLAKFSVDSAEIVTFQRAPLSQAS